MPLLVTLAALLLAAPDGAGDTAAPPALKKLARVPAASPELAAELYQFDAGYRHGTPEQFAELESRAEALAKRHPAADDQARVWGEVAHVAGQSGIDKQAGRVRKYAVKCLAVSRDPLERRRMQTYLASAVDVGGAAFPKGRREAAAILLTAYRETLAQELPDKAPELPAVGKIGDAIGQGGPEEAQARATYAAQLAARAEAEFVRDQVDGRDVLVTQLRDLFKPEPNRHGRNPQGPDELRALAGKTLDAEQVRLLLERVMK